MTVCMRESHEFYYNIEDFYSHKWSNTLAETEQWNLPFQHPFHATIIACFYSGTILVPILYGKIYRLTIYVLDN